MRDGLKDMVVYNNLIYMILWPENMSGSFLASYDGEINIDLVHEFYSANVDLSSRTSVNMTVADSNLFFWFGDGTHEAPLYVTNGTSNGTKVVNTDFERYNRSLVSRTIGVIGNKILFEGIDSNNDRHLWSSDGTIAGTFRIEIPSGIEMNPRYFTTYKDKLLFSGYYGSQPFSAPSISTLQSDGSITGTEVILEPDNIPNHNISNGYWLTNHNDSLFMVGRNTSWPFNNDLFKSDGTAEGTLKVSLIGEDSGNEISQIVSAAQNLFFIGRTDSLGRELYIYKSALIDSDGDGFYSEEDCDDDNPNINPAQPEEPYNGIDDDCDPLTLDDDLDEDGFVLALDCDDENADINPNANEVAYNGIDDDCNTATLDDDLDEDGFLLADDCDDTDSGINPDAEEIPNNEIDEDCDGMDLMTSTHEIANTTINIYPNPTTDFIKVETQGPLNFQMTLYSLDGKMIFTESNSNVINVNTIPKGTYLLKIKDLQTGLQIIERIIIEK